MVTTYTPGQQVLVKLARADRESAAIVVEDYGNGQGAAVRLFGLTPAPYEAGMVLPIDADRIRKMKGW